MGSQPSLASQEGDRSGQDGDAALPVTLGFGYRPSTRARCFAGWLSSLDFPRRTWLVPYF